MRKKWKHNKKKQLENDKLNLIKKLLENIIKDDKKNGEEKLKNELKKLDNSERIF